MQEASSTTPLAIDLTGLKSSLNSDRHNASSRHSTPNLHSSGSHQKHYAARAATMSPQQLPPEYQYKMIFYCNKCPARFAQKHSSISTEEAKNELNEHKRCHGGQNEACSSNTSYCCEFCDFTAAHETLIQAHRYVHTQQYQDKFNVLYKNCKEDAENSAPKLVQITSNKANAELTIWVVDNEINQEMQQQQQHISSSSSNNGYDNANSLLKKQLEAGAAAVRSNTASPRDKEPNNNEAEEEEEENIKLLNAEAEESSMNNPSTSASVATSDLAGDMDVASCSAASPAPLEKCLHCPFESHNSEKYKTHLQHHFCISKQKEAFSCEHCDFSHSQEKSLEQHVKLHFNALEKLKSVAYFTSYDQLELSVEQNADDEEMECEKQQDEKKDQLQSDIAVSIKQEDIEMPEHNNNNEENAINENIMAEESESNNLNKIKSNAEQSREEATPNKPCNKIILYKNDGCLSIKKDFASTSASNSLQHQQNTNNTSNNNNLNNLGDNISDRLRRRISRNANNSQQSQHVNGSEDGSNHSHSQSSHKTILVNAKTGQVISRN